MKIAIIGYSGSGKSTLAQVLGKHYSAEVLHLDSVHHMAGWKERPADDEKRIVQEFLDTHDTWIIDGNYTNLSYDRRMEEADMIIQLLFNRFTCLHRAWLRYRKYRHTTRPDMAEGCEEKLDAEFIQWILWKGRKKKTRDRYRRLQEQYSNKVTVLKNQKALNAFLDQLH